MRCGWILGTIWSCSAVAETVDVGAVVPAIGGVTLWTVFGVCLILLVGWWRYVRPQLTQSQRLSSIKVVAECRIGTKQRLLVVQVGEAQWLLGATSQSITLLAKLDEPIEAQSAHLMWANWLQHGKS